MCTCKFFILDFHNEKHAIRHVAVNCIIIYALLIA